MADKNFPDGFIFKKKHENAPEFIKGMVAINVGSFVAWLGKQEHNGWIDIDLKESREGKYYAERNMFKKTGMTEKPPALAEDNIDLDSIPF